MTADQEALLLWLALIGYVLAGSLAVIGLVLGRRPERTFLLLLVVGLLLHTAALGLRWQRLGHGPFVNLHEILSSNLWSLLLAYALAYWRLPVLRPAAGVIMPVMFIMMAWLLLTAARDSVLPPTYDTLWLYIHIGFGKVFLGALLIALTLALVILLRPVPGLRRLLARLPGDVGLDELAYRFLALGFIFDTLMLVAGGIWAQDAWGRYWDWDTLEVWSLVTWLLLAMGLHIRPTFQPPPLGNALVIVVAFLVAYVNFFGVPFLSQMPHRGVI